MSIQGAYNVGLSGPRYKFSKKITLKKDTQFERDRKTKRKSLTLKNMIFKHNEIFNTKSTANADIFKRVGMITKAKRAQERQTNPSLFFSPKIKKVRKRRFESGDARMGSPELNGF